MDGLTLSIPKGVTYSPRGGGSGIGFWLDIVNDEGRDRMERASAFIMLMQLGLNVRVAEAEDG